MDPAALDAAIGTWVSARLAARRPPGRRVVLAVDGKTWLEGRRDIVEDVVRVLAGPAHVKIMESLDEAASADGRDRWGRVERPDRARL